MADKQYKHALFIFRRDLRLTDNTALIAAHKLAKDVSPCFIFNPKQLENNPYRSDFSVRFMIDSLAELAQSIKAKNGTLNFFYDQPEKILPEIIKKNAIDLVIFNKDYTPFSIKRDQALFTICQKLNSAYQSFDDALLIPPGEVRKDDGSAYSVFTPFFRKASKQIISKPQSHRYKNFNSKALIYSKTVHLKNVESTVKEIHTIPGGRKAALKILRSLKRHSNYKEQRDFPAQAATTGLSAHHKFGTCSIRETYFGVTQLFGQEHHMVSELFWRDFYVHIAHHFPHVFGSNFRPTFDKVKWHKPNKLFKAWCQGKTGFPIIDAGMRELNTTGFMHNRVRMIVASFLTKDLHIHWKEGEKYFASKLVDYDPAVNNGSWQWAASTGCDAQPYFRIFNPWLQQKKFDPDCDYIKKWIPELKGFHPKEIHKHFENPVLGYTQPICDHRVEKEITLDMFEEVR